MNYTLHMGDCLDYLKTLPAGSVDAVITDPPYGMDYQHGYSYSAEKRVGTRHVNTKIIGDDSPFDPSPFLGYPVVVLFGANHFANKLPISKGWLFWDKRPGMRPNDHSDGELIWTNRGGHLKRIVYMWTGVCRAGEAGEIVQHPTQKPTALMRHLIRAYTAPGATILDPFMGSGTTGVACMQTGRNFIGVEIDPGYFAIAKKRIEDAAAQLPLIPHESEPKHEQEALWP